MARFYTQILLLFAIHEQNQELMKEEITRYLLNIDKIVSYHGSDKSIILSILRNCSYTRSKLIES